MSVISHSYYLVLSKEKNKLPEDKILTVSAYYYAGTPFLMVWQEEFF
jgi:hypothetical protein